MEKQFGYPEKFCERYRELFDGQETKRTVPFAAGAVAGDTLFGASRKRPLLAISVAYDLLLKNTHVSELMTGSVEFIVNRLFDLFKANDGDDVLVDIGLNSEAAIQDTFFRERAHELFDDIAFGDEDSVKGELLIPCYSEVPVMLSMRLHDLALEYSDGTFELGNSTLTLAGMYGDGQLGFEQPMLEQHAEALGVGRGTLESIKMRKPYYGVIIVRNSYARGVSKSVAGGMVAVLMKDNDNEVVYDSSGASLGRLVRPSGYERALVGIINAIGGAGQEVCPESLEVLTDDRGHMNTDVSETAVNMGNVTTLEYVAIFSPRVGETAKKYKATASKASGT